MKVVCTVWVGGKGIPYLSTSAAYAIISYQTAFLKYYYPKEFMAALLTSVLDNSSKISEYIVACRLMGISILPPDINEGEGNFSVSNGDIRYGLSAIKGVGKAIVEVIIKERKEHGKFLTVKDFVQRLPKKEINKRIMENFIKSGAFDCLPGNRQQLMMVYANIIEDVDEERKNQLTGQMSFFDFVSKEEKQEYEITFPNVKEYEKEVLLAFEKETLGIYISGHPMQEYEQLWKKNITATTIDFLLDEETNKAKLKDGMTVVIGGIITGKTIKTTRNNSVMAFITVEDLMGTLEVIIFPRDYEKYKAILEMEKKIFLKGKVSIEEERAGKLICQSILPFEDISKQIWIKFKNKENFTKNQQQLDNLLCDCDGSDTLVVYCEEEKIIKYLPKSKNIDATIEVVDLLKRTFGGENIRVVQKSIENF